MRMVARHIISRIRRRQLFGRFKGVATTYDGRNVLHLFEARQWSCMPLDINDLAASVLYQNVLQPEREPTRQVTQRSLLASPP